MVKLGTFLSLEINLQKVGSKWFKYLLVLEMFEHLSYFDPHYACLASI